METNLDYHDEYFYRNCFIIIKYTQKYLICYFGNWQCSIKMEKLEASVVIEHIESDKSGNQTGMYGIRCILMFYTCVGLYSTSLN